MTSQQIAAIVKDVNESTRKNNIVLLTRQIMIMLYSVWQICIEWLEELRLWELTDRYDELV